MHSIVRIVTIAAALAFGASQFALAAQVDFFQPVITPEGLTKMSAGSPSPFAVLSPQHQLFFVRKAGAPGQLAAPGSYKLANGMMVTVGKNGMVMDPNERKGVTPNFVHQFSDPSKFTGGVHYYT